MVRVGLYCCLFGGGGGGGTGVLPCWCEFDGLAHPQPDTFVARELAVERWVDEGGGDCSG